MVMVVVLRVTYVVVVALPVTYVVVLRVTYVFIILTKYSQAISGESYKQDLNSASVSNYIQMNDFQ